MEPPPPGPPAPDMDFSSAVLDDPSSALWDWGDLLDFTADDQIPLPFDADSLSSPPPHPPEDDNPIHDRVRKRDPRLTCSNFLAGVIPCACPELDEMLREEEEAQKESGGPAKKRPRAARASGGKARCQVPGCEADISELKGYHRRHRVCLRCANASVVVIDGESKRYCQQCGKFHVLSDFDEGKRSCRRKLERHNNRRRRKSVDPKCAVGSLPAELVLCDDGGEDAGKGSLFLSGPIAEKEARVESESGQIATFCSAPDSKNSDSVASFGASGETRLDGEKDNFNNSVSTSNWDSKNVYSSPCPTGRISFKLYDWNPAEFPRRLRQQIFQWLGSMPVELEGYIRPGCIILTVFTAMPKLMWAKITEDPVSYVQDFVVAPGSLLSGKGNMFVYLNSMTFQVMKNVTSMMEVKVQAPRLHYVHPICFEAGKPMEFVACGSNLLQPKVRFLVSFAEKYMEYDYCVASSCGETEGCTTSISSHQLYKINIPHAPNLFGPAFIEVESESGLSNFITVLIADKEICSEMEIVRQRLDRSIISQGSQFASTDYLSSSCEVSAIRQTALSEFILDLAWLLKEPKLDEFQQTTTSSQIQRFSYLLRFLIHNQLINTLEKILQNLKFFMDIIESNSAVSGSSDPETRILLMYIDCAKDIIHNKLKESSSLILHPGSTKLERDFVSQSFPQNNMVSAAPVLNQDMIHLQSSEKSGAMVGLASTDRSETVPLLNREVVMNMNHVKEWPRKSCVRVVSRSVFSSRPAIFVIATMAICVGICAVVIHPNKVSEFAVSIRRCLFDRF